MIWSCMITWEDKVHFIKPKYFSPNSFRNMLSLEISASSLVLHAESYDGAMETHELGLNQQLTVRAAAWEPQIVKPWEVQTGIW